MFDELKLEDDTKSAFTFPCIILGECRAFVVGQAQASTHMCTHS